MKKCNKCGQTKELTQYSKDNRNKDGLQSICHDCRRAYKQAMRARRIGKPPTVTEKRCNRCSETKPSSCFYAEAGISDGLATICKQCKDTTADKWRTENRERYNAAQRVYNKKHYHRLRLNRYDLSVEEHAKMLAEQKGVCAMCQKPPAGKRPLCVDHDHETGEVRGLLCYGCNRIMHAIDNPEILLSAQEYKKKAG